MTSDTSRLLDFKVTFVSRHADAWKEIIEAEPSPDEVAPAIAAVGGAGGWILQTYLFLRRRGIPVEISRAMPRGGVCILHSDDIGIRNYPLGAFVVAVRPDRSECVLCDIQVVQNARLVHSDRDFYMPYWPQPGLLPRDRSRGNRVERLGFVGRVRNLAAHLQTGDFERRLGSMGIELVIREDRWWDYRDLDVVLGVRDGKPSFMDAKPASKLVNAWLAGCPALLGRESAFVDLRRSDLDYFEVVSQEDILAALASLKADAALYASMVENGFERSEDFRSDPITDRWVDLLRGPVRDAFVAWSAEGRARHLGRHVLRSARSRIGVKAYER